MPSPQHSPRCPRPSIRAGAIIAALCLAAVGSLGFYPRLAASASDESRGPRGCSLATLKGRYLFGGTGNLPPPAFGVTRASLASTAGTHIFNGDGTGTDIVTLRVNGVSVLEDAVGPFTYTVDENCSGAYAVPNGPSFGMAITPTGDELIPIATDPGDVVVFGPSRLVSRK